VYKFMPVRADNYISGIGGVNPVKSYNSLIECTWGNLNDPSVTVDRESYRNSRLPRQNSLRTAESLMNIGEKEKAIAVLDTCLYYFPDNKVRYDVLLVPFAELYYTAGEIEKANAIMNRLVEIFGDDLRYYSSLDPGFARTYYNDEFQRTMSYMDRLIEMAGENGQQELKDKAENVFMLYAR